MHDYRIKVRAHLQGNVHSDKDQIADSILASIQDDKMVLDMTYEGAGKGAPMRFTLTTNAEPYPMKSEVLVASFITRHNPYYINANYYEMEVESVQYIGRTEV